MQFSSDIINRSSNNILPTTTTTAAKAEVILELLEVTTAGVIVVGLSTTVRNLTWTQSLALTFWPRISEVAGTEPDNVKAIAIRVGLAGILYYSYNYRDSRGY